MDTWATDLVERLGYPGIAVLMLLEMIVPVVQSEIVMPFAGFAARDSRLTLLGVVVAGVVGSQAGALALYGSCRWLPEERVRGFLARHGGRVGLSEERLERAEDRFRRHDVRAVLVGRFLPGVRGAIAVPAGLLSMPLGRFLLALLPGAVLWTGGLGVAGYLLAEQYQRAQGWVLPVGLGLLALVAVVWFVRRRRRSRDAG